MKKAGHDRRLSSEFYLNPDVVDVARSLIGKVLCTGFDGVITKGVISETEAYAGVTDKASHAYGGRFTARTATMFESGGVCYVYLCYGIHHLFNVVSNVKGVPHAVLIRGLIPYEGIPHMQRRRPVKKGTKLAAGPGTLTQAMGIRTDHDGIDLTGDLIWIEEFPEFPKPNIAVTPRIGVDYAGEDALLPYRFLADFGDYFERV